MIPQRDIRFVQQKAFKLLSQGGSIENLRKLVLEEGGDESQADSLPQKFLADYEFILSETNKKDRKNSSAYTISGIVLFVGGVLLALISYLSTDEAGFVWPWGIMLLGAILFFRGIGLRNSH